MLTAGAAWRLLCASVVIAVMWLAVAWALVPMQAKTGGAVGCKSAAPILQPRSAMAAIRETREGQELAGLHRLRSISERHPGATAPT